MSTNIMNKGMYIARPKKERMAELNADEKAFTNKLTGKPFVAYPKSIEANAKSTYPSIKMQEGLYIAYPARQKQAMSVSRAASPHSTVYLSENYAAPPPHENKPVEKKRSGLIIYRLKLKNRIPGLNWLSLFRMKFY